MRFGNVLRSAECVQIGPHEIRGEQDDLFCILE